MHRRIFSVLRAYRQAFPRLAAHRRLAPLATLTLLLAACGGGGGGGSASAGPPPVATTNNCAAEGQKQFVLDVARDWYLWYDEMAAVNPGNYATASAFLAALTAPLAEDFRDPGFSYLTTVAEDNTNFSTGAYAGFGFRFAIDSAGRYLISDVFESGTAFSAGFVRGAELLAVDTGDGFTSLVDFAARGASSDEIFGPSQTGVERGFRLRIGEELREVSIAKVEIDIPPIAEAAALLQRPGLPPVGYLHLRAFTTSAIAEFDALFEEFQRAGVTEFVVDLRYNDGGILDVSDRLLDLLGGSIAGGRLAYALRHNDLRRDEDFNYRFRQRSLSVAPNRIAFITTESTASASELLINSLAPYTELVLAGSDTLGKAVGQYAFDQPGCSTRLRLVSFESVNADNAGGYYTGLVDTGRFTLCAVEDTFTGAFGDPEEPMLATALGWLNNAECPAVSALAGAARRALPRSPTLQPLPSRPGLRSFWVQ